LHSLLHIFRGDIILVEQIQVGVRTFELGVNIVGADRNVLLVVLNRVVIVLVCDLRLGLANEPTGLARVLEFVQTIDGAGADKRSDDQSDEKGIVDAVLLHDRYLREFSRQNGRRETISAAGSF